MSDELLQQQGQVSGVNIEDLHKTLVCNVIFHPRGHNDDASVVIEFVEVVAESLTDSCDCVGW